METAVNKRTLGCQLNAGHKIRLTWSFGLCGLSVGCMELAQTEGVAHQRRRMLAGGSIRTESSRLSHERMLAAAVTWKNGSSVIFLSQTPSIMLAATQRGLSYVQMESRVHQFMHGIKWRVDM